MKLFNNRFDDEYIGDLLEHLSFEGSSGLVQTAITIKNPFEHEGQKYDKIARIYFLGMSATTLFDVGGNFTKSKVAERIEEIFQDINLLNEKGIFLSMRILLIYPYSDFSFSVIQAETSTFRSSVTEPEFLRDFSIVEEVNEKAFWSSPTIKNQQNSLKQIQSLIKNYRLADDNNPNEIKVRFTPSPINTCILLVNHTGYYDSYLLAKEKRKSNNLSYLNPVMKIVLKRNPKEFKSFEEHYRYLWTLDTTIYSRDATKFDDKKNIGLDDIITPDRITFNYKAERIKNKLSKREPAISCSIDDINKWKFKLTHLLVNSTQMTRVAPHEETLFITCSWHEDKKKKKNLPNSYAKKLSEWLNRDFGIKNDAPVMKINIMEAAIGDFLFQQLYKTLNDTTIAIVLMTKDIESTDGLYYSKPNVYHELGFLMKKLGNSSRVAVMLEEGVFEPSNIRDLSRINFNSDNFDEKYDELVDWISICNTYINSLYFDEARKNHKLKD